MPNPDDLALFVGIIDAGSLSAAARAAGVPKSSVSRRLVALETRLNAQLVQRSTRKLSLTDAGQRLYDRCSPLVVEALVVEADAMSASIEPRGVLRVTATGAFGRLYVGPLPGEFLSRREDVSAELSLRDRTVNLIDEGFDIAIRMGEREESGLMGAKLGDIERILCAAPSRMTSNQIEVLSAATARGCRGGGQDISASDQGNLDNPLPFGDNGAALRLDPLTRAPEKHERMSTNAFASGAAWIDGAIVPIAEARIPITDWGFLRSDATYDVVHTWNGKFFRLEEHMTRFQRGVERLRLKLPISFAEVAGVLRQLLATTGLSNAYLAMIATRGSPMPGSRDPRLCRNRFYAFAIPFVWIADPEKQKTGLHMAVSAIERISPSAVDPTVKNYHWLDFQMALLNAYEAGAETVVLVDRDGHICEGPGFNIFAARGGRLSTPSSGVLEGITRRTVMEVAAAAGIPVAVRPLPASELREADEIIITSTAGGVMPVTKIDHKPVGAGAPGDIFRTLHQAYWRLHGV